MTATIRRSLLVLFLGAAVLGGAACAPPPDRAVATADVLADVRAAWVAAYNAGDADMLAAFFADDAVLLPAGEPAVSGRAAVEVYLKKMLDGWAGTLENVSYDVRASGDLAIDRAAYAVHDVAGAAPRRGKYMMVWQRDDEGAWKIVWDMWNSDG